MKISNTHLSEDLIFNFEQIQHVNSVLLFVTLNRFLPLGQEGLIMVLG